jgi:lysyl-tRNA synthetase class 2
MDEFVECAGVVSEALGRPPDTWERVTVADLFTQHCGIDVHSAEASTLSSHPEPWDDAFMRRWVTDIEPHLTGGLLIHEWPAPLAALARLRSQGNHKHALRFEVYLDGIELANAFGELGHPGEQLSRFRESNRQREQAGELPHPVDPHFIRAVGQLPVCSGIAVGLERMIAVMRGSDDLTPGRID